MSRRVPFSAKKKKQQLKEKRMEKKARAAEEAAPKPVIPKRRQPVMRDIGNGLVSVFAREPEDVIQERIARSRKPYDHLPKTSLEISTETLFGHDGTLDLPIRPDWRGKTPAQLQQDESDAYDQWLRQIYESCRLEELGYFEHNLEVWRQLWRVVERSDVILVVADIRHPVLHFPPSLYNWVSGVMKRPIVLVLNKTDLVPPEVTDAWVAYFKQRFPLVHVSTFTCYPELKDAASMGSGQARRTQNAFRPAAGVGDLFRACRDVKLLKRGVLVDWDQLIAKYDRHRADEDDSEDDEMPAGLTGKMAKARVGKKGRHAASREHAADDASDAEDLPEDATPEDEEAEAVTEGIYSGADPRSDMITIGLVGHPNVGKSSIVNGIRGKKVVSASKTPGHTKHFQTIHLSKTVRLCDSPGLVFPSKVSRAHQILSGVFNIAQVNEPYSVVQFLAERLPLPEILRLSQKDHPAFVQREEGSLLPTTFEWTAWDLCEAYAHKRGYINAKSSRPDAYRAANMILRMAFDGRELLLSFKPPGFYESQPDFADFGDDLAQLAAHGGPDQAESADDQDFSDSEADTSDEDLSEDDEDDEDYEEDEEEDEDDEEE